jgi:hypothetical protein
MTESTHHFFDSFVFSTLQDYIYIFLVYAYERPAQARLPAQVQHPILSSRCGTVLHSIAGR